MSTACIYSMAVAGSGRVVGVFIPTLKVTVGLPS